MDKFDYIVNFWFGPRGSKKEYTYDLKTKQAKQLKTNYGAWFHNISHYFTLHAHCKFLTKHKIKNLKNVIFVINLTNEDKYNNVLNDVNEIVEWYNLEDKVTVIKHDNKHHSYGAWNEGLKYLVKKSLENSNSKSLSALLARPTSKYAFLCEDDYVPTDGKFFKPFFKKFDNDQNLGFVAQHVGDIRISFDIKSKFKNANDEPYDKSYPRHNEDVRHAMVSNGFIKMRVCKEIYAKKSKKFILKLDKPNIYNRLSDRAWEQVLFTRHIEELGYKIDGISDSCYIPFDANNSNKHLNFGKKEWYTPIKPYTYPEELGLKKLTENDLSWFLDIRNDDSTRNFLLNNNQFTLEEAKKWFKGLSKSPLYPYFIMYYTSRRVVENNMREYNNIRTVEYIENEHNVGYIRQYWREIDGEKIIELGADVHPKHRRKGYAKAAYIKLLKNLESACLWVFEDNFARNLYFELGFRDNGKTKINRGRKEYQMIWRRKN